MIIISIILNTLVNIWSGLKPFIKVVLKPKTKMQNFDELFWSTSNVDYYIL